MRGVIQRWLGATPENDVLRWMYRGLLVATVAVLVLDYTDLGKRAETRTAALPSDAPFPEQPSATPLPQTQRGGEKRAAPVQEANARLRDKMTFELAADGRLIATGTIYPGTAARFAEEVEKRGSYVKTVVLQSPGGSVQDALAMGKLIRAKNFSTEVENGRYCASSCPLVFAGGVERKAGPKSAIGVHQVSAATTREMTGAAGMENAQRVSAECQSYLRSMGIDLGVWVRAMETPPDELFYFKSEELLELKLATGVSGKSAVKAGA
ncbi:MAG: hypothetical protein Q7T81_01515 [Pseudolabrys sp.]|nr:hypothetical protein [Pseudolabrys sp.]